MMSKGSDINVGNIEEDINEIEKIKDLLRFLKGHGWIPNISKTINVDKTIKAIEATSSTMSLGIKECK